LCFDYFNFYKRILYTVFNSLGFELIFSGWVINKIEIIPPEKLEVVWHARAILLLNATFLLSVYLIANSVTIAILFLITPFTASFLNTLLAEAQHQGLESMKELGPLFHSRTILLPPPISFIYANMNYHAEHHLAPSIPYYNLPKFHEFLTLEQSSRGEVVSAKYFLSESFIRDVT
jgi:fatty acid desaturase